MRKIVGLFGLIFLFLLSACKDIEPGDYDASEVGQVKKVTPGLIISKRAVKFHSKTKSDSEYLDRGQGYVYVVKLNNGKIVSVAQSEDLRLKVKQRVLVVYGKHTRIYPMMDQAIKS